MHTIDRADDHFLASKRAAYHRRIWPAGARATARRAWTRAQRRHGRELCRQALDREAWADDSDFEEMLRQQDLAEDWPPSWMDDADERDRAYSNMMIKLQEEEDMREMALATLAADAELWSGIENKY